VRIVFVNGYYRPELMTGDLPVGLTIASLSELLCDEPDSMRAILDAATNSDDSLTALNLAFAADGYVLTIAEGASIKTPIEISNVVTAGTAGVACHTRNIIRAGRDSVAVVMETFEGRAGEAYWTQPISEILLQPGAVLRHYKHQHEGIKAFHIAKSDIHVGHGARFESFVLSTGAALSRNEIAVVLDGPNASCRLDGGYLMRERQHVDNTTEIIHAKPHTTSVEVYKGVLDDQARGVFQGRIVVQKDAQKSDGHQLSKTILLSDRAEIDTKPELEIFADDVKCSHGATAGELDEDALFYLRARGIGLAEARRLLVEAFISDALSNIGDSAVREEFERRVGNWMLAKAEYRP
jgi:Fe-S cluster assembly protein SufD